MAEIGETVVSGEAVLNPQFLPEYLIIGGLNPQGVVATGPETLWGVTGLSVSIAGTERIRLETADEIMQYIALFGNGGIAIDPEGGNGAAPLYAAVIPIAVGGKGSANVQIRIKQGASGGVKKVYGYTTMDMGKNGVVYTAFTQQVQPKSSLLIDSFDLIATDDNFESANITFAGGWNELLTPLEARGVMASMRTLFGTNTDVITAGSDFKVSQAVGFYLDNRLKIVESVKLYTKSSSAGNVLRVGRETLKV